MWAPGSPTGMNFVDSCLVFSLLDMVIKSSISYFFHAVLVNALDSFMHRVLHLLGTTMS